MRTKLLAALAASALIMGGTAASAQVAAPTTTSTARAGAPVSDSSELRGRTAWVLALIAAGLIIWGAIELFGGDDEAFPVSP